MRTDVSSNAKLFLCIAASSLATVTFAQQDSSTIANTASPKPNIPPSIALRGFVQTVGYFNPRDSQDTYSSQFVIRRARLDLRGTFGKHVEARIHTEFAGTPTVLDAYLQINLVAAFAARFGIFKSPVSQERLQPVPTLLCSDFAYTASVAPNRDIGVQFSGKPFSGIINYQLALLNGAQDGLSSTGDISDAKDIAGRLVVAPWAKQKDHLFNSLNIGVGASLGTQDNEPLPSLKTPGRTKIFEYRKSTTGNGTVYRVSPQAQVFAGKISLLAEYILAHHAVEDTSGLKGELENSAWAVTAGLTLFGGSRSAKGYTVTTPLSIADKSFGALELVGRAHGFHADKKTFADFASSAQSVERVISLEGGANWHIINNARLLLAYTQSRFEGGAAGGNRRTEHVVSVTADISF